VLTSPEREVTMNGVCNCYFCRAGKPHPVNAAHSETHQLSDRLLKAESLNPADRIQVWACMICGHLTEGGKPCTAKLTQPTPAK
jgi:rubrerythrin